MKTQASTFILVLLLIAPAKAQQYIPVPEKAPYRGLNFTVKATPTFLLDRFAATIPIGLELGFLECMGLGLDYGIPFNSMDADWNGTEPKTLKENIRIGAQLRFYFRQRYRNSMFTGIEGFYKYQVYHRGNMTYSNSFYTSYDAIDVTVAKTATGIGLILGTRQQLRKRLCLELYAGLGKKHIYNDIDFAEKRTGKRDESFW